MIGKTKHFRQQRQASSSTVGTTGGSQSGLDLSSGYQTQGKPPQRSSSMGPTTSAMQEVPLGAQLSQREPSPQRVLSPQRVASPQRPQRTARSVNFQIPTIQVTPPSPSPGTDAGPMSPPHLFDNWPHQPK